MPDTHPRRPPEQSDRDDSSPTLPSSDDAAEPAPSANGAVRNRLLAALPETDRLRLGPHLESVAASQYFTFYLPGESIPYVYFPESGVASLLMLGQNGEAVEVGTVGNEGMVGIPVFLGQDSTPGKALMQVPGTVLRMSVATFRGEVGGTRKTRLEVILQRYTHALMIQMAQGVACNRLHVVERRAARWLLTTRDRVGDTTYQLTQEFLAQMLGVRRASVSDAASALQDEGLITYTRGIITIRDPAGLEARACVCYRIIRDEFDRMLAEL